MERALTVHSNPDDAGTLSSALGERSLYQSVLVRLVADACGRGLAGPPPRQREQLRENARRWLLHSKRDFEMVCAFAGFEPELVRAGVRRLASEGWPSDEWSQRFEVRRAKQAA